MKKLLAILFVAGALTACNDNSQEKMPEESSVGAEAPATSDSTAAQAADSTLQQPAETPADSTTAQ